MAKRFVTVSAPVAAPKPESVAARNARFAALPKTLQNPFCKAELRMNEKGPYQIHGDSLVDPYNLPTFFTRNKRGLMAQWAALVAAFTPTMTHSQVVMTLSHAGASVHDYCAMD